MSTKICSNCKKALTQDKYADGNWEEEDDNIRCCEDCVNKEKNKRSNTNVSRKHEDDDHQQPVQPPPTHMFAWKRTQKWHPCRQLYETETDSYLQIWIDENTIASVDIWLRLYAFGSPPDLHTAPNSAKVSIATRDSPAIIAGRAAGNIIL